MSWHLKRTIRHLTRTSFLAMTVMGLACAGPPAVQESPDQLDAGVQAGEVVAQEASALKRLSSSLHSEQVPLYCTVPQFAPNRREVS